jgi:hypothetical protein
MSLLALPIAASLLAAAAQPPSVEPLRLQGDSSARLLWMRTFASQGDDWINDIVPISGERYLAVGFLGRVDGFSSDWRALAATLDESGTVLSTREYGEGGGVDAFWSADEAEDGRLILSGFTTRIGAGGIDALMVITDEGGEMLVERAFGGGGYDRFTDLAGAGDGYVFLGHSQPENEDRRRLYAVRTGTDGQPLWERIIEGPESHGALYIEPVSDGGFIVAGGLGRGEDSDLLIIKLDPDGRELWRRTVGTPEADDVNHGLTLLPNGNIVVVGYSQSWNSRGNAILAATLSPSGEVLRQELLDGPDDDRPILAKVDAEGRVSIVGYTRSAGAGGWDMIVAQLDAQGAFRPGVLTVGGPADDNGTAIRPLADGSLLVAGYSNGLGGGAQDAFVARLSAPSFETPHPAFQRRSVP